MALTVMNPDTRALAQYILDFHPTMFKTQNEVLAFAEEREKKGHKEYINFLAAGGDEIGADEIKNKEMYADLFFSPTSLINEISMDNFDKELSIPEQAELLLKAEKQGLLDGYELTDDFMQTEEFEELEEKLFQFLKSEFKKNNQFYF